MMTILALSVGGPLMLMFGTITAAVLGCAAGFVIGSALGRTRPETPLATTLRLTRERLAAVSTHLEKAATRLNAARRSDAAGSALVVGRRVSDLSAELGRIARESKHAKEGSA